MLLFNLFYKTVLYLVTGQIQNLAFDKSFEFDNELLYPITTYRLT